MALRSLVERVLETLVGNSVLLDGVDERFKRRGLHIDIAAADEETVASSRDGFDGGLRDGVRLRDRLHLQVVAEDDAWESELVTEQRLHDSR